MGRGLCVVGWTRRVSCEVRANIFGKNGMNRHFCQSRPDRLSMGLWLSLLTTMFSWS